MARALNFGKRYSSGIHICLPSGRRCILGVALPPAWVRNGKRTLRQLQSSSQRRTNKRTQPSLPKLAFMGE